VTARLFGLIGKKRSGKDTFASMLVEEGGFRRLAFADPLKEAALRLDPIVGRPALPDQLAPSSDVRLSQAIERLGWERAKDSIPEVRRILQYLGTDAIRYIDDGFWLREGLRRASEAASEGIPAVFTDCRFPNEADGVRERGGTIVRIVRPGVDTADEHPSEKALDHYVADLTIRNDFDVAYLEDAARILLRG
jgi:hypothetical protein